MTPEAISSERIATYYDDFSKRLLRDYIRGNRRVERAARRVQSVFQSSTSSVLDVGCGVGTTSDSYVRSHPSLTVTGVDISPVNIEVATKLFASPRCKFAVSDLSVPPAGAPFDVIALIDVYEHVPARKRPEFNRTLGECLAPQGTAILTFPSEAHQLWLERNSPNELQVVDEVIRLGHVAELADTLNACVSLYECVTIWRPGDYVHVVLKRASASHTSLPEGSLTWRAGRRLGRICRWPGEWLGRQSRARLVRERLGAHHV